MPLPSSNPSQPKPAKAEAVLLVHGLGGHRILMQRLSRQLSAKGYRVVNWGYRSVWGDIRDHARRLRQRMERLELAAPPTQLHLVTHSMGAIVARAALADYAPDSLKRIVMLCPPNHGSHVATRIAPWVGWLSQPLTQIRDATDSYVNSLPQDLAQRYSVGVIMAGGDFVVQPSSTHLPGVLDQITLPGRHSALLFNSQTATEAAHFLKFKRFTPSARQHAADA